MRLYQNPKIPNIDWGSGYLGSRLDTPATRLYRPLCWGLYTPPFATLFCCAKYASPFGIGLSRLEPRYARYAAISPLCGGSIRRRLRRYFAAQNTHRPLCDGNCHQRPKLGRKIGFFLRNFKYLRMVSDHGNGEAKKARIAQRAIAR